ncbi:MAG: type 4a pilus biogenesis protein PilO [Ignavibacteria bacterium]|jgi:hypothetical protein
MPIKIPKWRNLVSLILLFTFVVLIFEVFPGIISNFNLVLEWIEQSNRIDKMSEVENELQTVTKRNSKLKGKISSIVSDYEDSRNASSILSMVDEIASKSNVDIETIKPQKIIKRDNLWLQSIKVDLTSKYENYYNFIRLLEHSQKVVLIKEIFIEHENSINGNLQISTKLEVYLNL